MATSESGAFSRLPDIMSLIGIMLTGAKRLARRVGANVPAQVICDLLSISVPHVDCAHRSCSEYAQFCTTR